MSSNIREELAADIEDSINRFEGERRVDRTTARAAADAILARFPRIAEEPEVEWGVTTKWGIGQHGSDRQGAEDYATALRRSIENGRESGDLNYDGHIVRRERVVTQWKATA